MSGKGNTQVKPKPLSGPLLQKYGRKFKPISVPPVPIEEIIDLVVDIPIVREAIPAGESQSARWVRHAFPRWLSTLQPSLIAGTRGPLVLVCRGLQRRATI